MVLHGDRDRITDPRGSYAFAVRAKAVTDRVARFVLPGAGHAMLTRPARWHALVVRFVLGVTKIAPEDPEIDDAMGRPAPNGLRLTLA